jgi:hypothetical protein
MNYKMVASCELPGHYGVRIMVGGIKRDFSSDERNISAQAIAQIGHAIKIENARLAEIADPQRASNRLAIEALFDCPIFTEEIPNQYCKQPCCSQKPWYVVTTPIGRITIGHLIANSPDQGRIRERSRSSLPSHTGQLVTDADCADQKDGLSNAMAIARRMDSGESIDEICELVKNVWEINWDGLPNPLPHQQVFPNYPPDRNTCEDHCINAWSLAEAKQFISRIIDAHVVREGVNDNGCKASMASAI